MNSSFIASLLAVAAFGFLEIFGRHYPARDLWWRLRRTRGREAVRKLRERYEGASSRRTPRLLALIVLIAIVAWVASASLLDKRWYQVVSDVLPSAIVAGALFRTPFVLRDVAQRMKAYEREAGDEPDAPPGDGGSSAIAL